MRRGAIWTALTAVFVFSLAAAMPAKAFYLNIPEYLQSLISKVKAQESDTLAPAPSTLSAPTAPTTPISPTAPSSQITVPTSRPSSDLQYQPQQMPPQPPQPGTQNFNYQNNQNGQEGGMRASDLKQMQRGVKQMENNLNRFKTMASEAAKKGLTLPADAQSNIDKLQAIIDSAKNANTSEEFGNIQWDDAQSLMQDLEQARQDIFASAQKLDGLKRGMKGMEQGIKMFDRQITQLTKQKVAVPQDVTDNLSKVKDIIAKVKGAKTWDEVEALGVDDLQDLMQNLDDSRQQLEIAARWPQTLKQVDKELKNLNSQLKRAKSNVARLAAKGTDLSANLAAFAEAVTKLQAVRDDAVAKMAAGNSQDAFDALQNDFFAQLDDAYQNTRVIELMSNLGRFTSEYKKGVSQAQMAIKRLAKKNIDTSDIQSLLDQMKEKGAEVARLIKAQPLDEDAVMSALQDFQDSAQQLQSSLQEASGGGSAMPWENGPQQFNSMSVPSNVMRYMPQQNNNSGMPGGQSNAPDNGSNGGPQIGPTSKGGPVGGFEKAFALEKQRAKEALAAM